MKQKVIVTITPTARILISPTKDTSEQNLKITHHAGSLMGPNHEVAINYETENLLTARRLIERYGLEVESTIWP